jgi:RNA methyltransferase, TrmH family
MADPRPAGEFSRRYRAARRDPTLALLEGFHALKHALRFGAHVLDVRTDDGHRLARITAELAPDLTERIAGLAQRVEPSIFRQLSPSPHPTGVIALARRAPADVRATLEQAGPAPIVLLDQPTHHGNIGAAVRVAAAAGAAGVLTTGPHDPWHPAALRGGAGLQFALPVMGIGHLLETDRPIVAMVPDRVSPWPVTTPARAVLVFGSERGGIGPELLERAERRVTIPMRAGVSSLNLATAVAVALYCGGRLSIASPQV